MSVPALTKLTIKHLRGSVASFELPFERGRKLTVVYGENGTGKSTICDALELLGKGKVGSLDNRGLGKTQTYWNTVSKTAADIAVSLETTGATCHARIVKGNVVVQPPEERPRVEVLRRSQLLNLIEARAGERYAAISRFIDVSGIESSENALRQLIRDLNGRLEVATARILENREALQQFATAAGKPAAGALAWGEAEVTRDPRAADAELAALRLLQATYGRLVEQPERLRDADEALERAREVAVVAQQHADSTLREIDGGAGEMMRVLEAARAYLQQHPDLAVCPLCGSDDAVSGLTERITERMQAFASFQRAQADNKAAEDAVRRAEHASAILHEQAGQDVAAFEQAREAFAWSADIVLPTTAALQERTALAAWLVATAGLPEAWQQAVASRQDRQQFLTTLKSALETHAENVQSHGDLIALLPRLGRALEIVEEERKTFTDTILTTIANEVGRMYEAVHPGEGLGQISLALDATRRASLEIGSSFGGMTGRPPQAYLSQAHLDTLGLCVFLALATLDDPANTIMVLDDVLASVDEPHIDRLIGMLHTEAAKFRHCMITTHYGPWRYKLRWGWLKHNQCQFIELSRWTTTGGMTLVRSVPEVERLRDLLAWSPPDPQLVCAKAGVILEAALDFLTYQYQCSVPRKQEARYTLGELLPAINKKLRQALRIEIREDTDAAGAPSYRTVQLAPLLDELGRIAQARNVIGCHFNELAFDLLETDALYFGELVLQLIEALADPDAGWPGNPKSGMYWANAGETRRLHPLKQPS